MVGVCLWQSSSGQCAPRWAHHVAAGGCPRGRVGSLWMWWRLSRRIWLSVYSYRGAASCRQPRQESTDLPAPDLTPSPHAQLKISLHLIAVGVVGPLSSCNCSVCTTPLVAVPPWLVPPLLPRGVPGHLVCVVLCAPWRVPPVLWSPGFVAPSCCFVPPWCPCACAVQLWLGRVGFLGPWAVGYVGPVLLWSAGLWSLWLPYPWLTWFSLPCPSG